MTAVMVLIVAIAVVLLIITIKRKRNQKFFGKLFIKVNIIFVWKMVLNVPNVFTDLEESRENSPARYTPNNAPGVSSGVENAGADNPVLDIDFPKVFKQMQTEQAMP